MFNFPVLYWDEGIIIGKKTLEESPLVPGKKKASLEAVKNRKTAV